METVEAGVEPTIKIGPDCVLVTEQQLVIDARHVFVDWDLRDINHVPIYFQDKKYYLVEKRKGQPPFAVRYVLLPWPAELTTSAKGFHSYDAEAVAVREAQRRGGQTDELIRAILMPFYPILGFLWSGTQRRLTRFGFAPHSVSGASIFTSFCFVFAQAVFAVVLINASLRSGKLALGGFVRAVSPVDSIHLGPIQLPIAYIDIALVVSLVADVVMRYSEYLREDEWAGGFLEWLKPRPKRS